MRSTLATASFAALALAMLAAPASAQAPWSASGALADADSQDEGHHRYDEHRIRLEAGRRYRIAVDSEAFDPVARLYRAGEAQPVAENDDSEGLNPRISYAPAQGGDYVLRVIAFAESGRGAYTAQVAALPPLPPAAAVPWSTTRSLIDAGGTDHVLRLEAGRRYRFSVESSAFDPVATLYSPGRGEEVARNDDSGGTLNSRISYTPSASGDYVLSVTAFSSGRPGDYRAAADLAPPLPAPVSTPGATVNASGAWSLWQGALEPGDPDVEGRRFDDYLIHVEAGQRRYISLEGQGFDTLVMVMSPDQRGSDTPEALDQDDDTGAGLNSFLVFAPDAAGDYIVRVTSAGGGAGGAYRLWISQ